MKFQLLGLLVGLSILSTHVNAISFWLVNDDMTCNNDHVLIEDSYGDYVLAEWYSGRISEGREVFSDNSIRSYGFKYIKDSNGNEMRIYVDDYDMSTGDAQEWCYGS